MFGQKGIKDERKSASENKPAIYKKWWFWAIIVVILIGIGGASSNHNNSEETSNIEAGEDASSQEKNESSVQEDTTKPADNATKEQKNALAKAQSYAKNMHMSKQSVFHQLTSEYGEGFSETDAQYAIDHLEGIDWKANALNKAKSYYNNMNMSKSRVLEQLTSEYGERFTQEEAQYAIDHLDD